MATGDSTVVRHLDLKPKVEDSSPATDTAVGTVTNEIAREREKEREREKYHTLT